MHRGESTEKDGAEKDNSNAHFPAKFAYLFLFESSNGDGVKKLSMGLDELVDSLLCQQLLVQLAAEQLLKDGESMKFPIHPTIFIQANDAHKSRVHCWPQCMQL